MEVLVVLLVGSLVIGALASTMISVIRGAGGLSYYGEMKMQADRLTGFLERDVVVSDGISFVTPGAGEILTFDLTTNGTTLATYTYKLDPSPPTGSSGVYAVYRETDELSFYKVATGFVHPTVPASAPTLFYFYNANNSAYDVSTAAGQNKAEAGTVKILFRGMMQRRLQTSQNTRTVSHEVSALIALKAKVSQNS